MVPSILNLAINFDNSCGEYIKSSYTSNKDTKKREKRGVHNSKDLPPLKKETKKKKKWFALFFPPFGMVCDTIPLEI